VIDARGIRALKWDCFKSIFYSFWVYPCLYNLYFDFIVWLVIQGHTPKKLSAIVVTACDIAQEICGCVWRSHGINANFDVAKTGRNGD
jgi:hypothetical protein